MTNFQTNVSYNLPKGIEGAYAGDGRNKDAISCVVEGTFKKGRFVRLGTDNNKQAKVLSVTGDVALGKLLGVTLLDEARSNNFPDYSNLENQEPYRDFANGESVAVLKSDKVFMIPETAMNPTTAVYIRHSGRQQVQTLVFSADLVADDVVSGNVNGVAISEVTYATSNAATLTAIASAIESAGTNVTAVSDGSHTITVTTNADVSDEDLTSFIVTSGGAGTATATVTETATSVHTDNIGRIRNDDDSSTATIAPTGTVRVLESVSAEELATVKLSIN